MSDMINKVDFSEDGKLVIQNNSIDTNTKIMLKKINNDLDNILNTFRDKHCTAQVKKDVEDKVIEYFDKLKSSGMDVFERDYDIHVYASEEDIKNNTVRLTVNFPVTLEEITIKR